MQSDLDDMRAAAKNSYRHLRPGACTYCGKFIKCDMYRHVSTFHLDLGQLWRCPVSWCTVCKGTPQDCMDHVRGAHDVPTDFKSTSLNQFFPPWTVRHQIWADARRPCHSGVSTDVLLFSEIHLSSVYLIAGVLVLPATTNIPDTKFPSPGSLAAMDRILAEDGDLALDGSSDFPSLPLLLLPIPTQPCSLSGTCCGSPGRCVA